MTPRTLETLTFDNTYTRLPEAFYAKLNPTPFQAAPYLVHANPVKRPRRAFVYFKAVIECWPAVGGIRLLVPACRGLL
jgi:hypothetical protein